MRRCVYTLLAQTDLRDIHDYIAEDDPDAALDFVTQLELACEKLTKMPESGRSRSELARGVRSLPVKRYIIFYRVTETTIDILRVLHGARDIERIYEE